MFLLRDAGYYTAVVGRQHFDTSENDRGYVDEMIVDQHAPSPKLTEQYLIYCEFLSERITSRVYI